MDPDHLGVFIRWVDRHQGLIVFDVKLGGWVGGGGGAGVFRECFA